MKKRIALWVMCLAMGTVFYGCSAPEPEESTDTGAASEETAETERYEGNAEDYKAALLIPGSLGDKSFFDASYQAVGLLEE